MTSEVEQILVHDVGPVSAGSQTRMAANSRQAGEGVHGDLLGSRTLMSLAPGGASGTP